MKKYLNYKVNYNSLEMKERNYKEIQVNKFRY